jgi:protein-disulfide isomerase
MSAQVDIEERETLGCGSTPVMRKAIWWIGATAALLAGTLVLVLLPTDAARPSHSADLTPVEASAVENVPPIDATDMRLGPEDAKVTVVEYGDFQCSNCAHYAPTMRELQAEYQDRVLFAYRFVPLDDTNGWIAAQAAYAAGLQGKFWQMYDLLYGRRSSWQDSSVPLDMFTDYAQELGLRTGDFVRDAKADSTVQFVRAQKTAAVNAGISELPTFVINGQAVLYPSYDELAKLLDEAIADGR